MVSKQQVQSVLDRVRPFLISDGGDIELLERRWQFGNGAADGRVRELSERAHDASCRDRDGAS